jgi:hypothetical protein
MPLDQVFLTKAVDLVKNNFGEYTATLYKTSFSAKSQEEILDFLDKLLTEFIGPEKATEQIKSLKK